MTKITPLILKEQKIKKAVKKPLDIMKNIWSRWGGKGAKKTDEERGADWDEIKNKINSFFTEFKIKPDPKDFENWINKNAYNLTPRNVTKLLAQKYIGGVKQVNLAKEIIKNLGDQFEFFTEMGTDQYDQLIKRALGVAGGNEQKLREYFGKFVNSNLDSLLGENDNDISQVAKKASDAIGMSMGDFGKKAANTEMIARMMTEYDQLFSKLPKIARQNFIKSIQNIDKQKASEALLQLFVKNIKFIDKDKTRGQDPVGYNSKILSDVLDIPVDHVSDVIGQALRGIEQTLPKGGGLTKESEIRDRIVSDLIKYSNDKWRPVKKQLEQMIDQLLENYGDPENLTNDEKQEIFTLALQKAGELEIQK